MNDLHLITIWARHEGDHGYADTPQFVAAFPSSLADAMCELYDEWLKVACDNYRDEVDSPVTGFFEGRASIDRPDWGTLSLVEDDAINPGWDDEQEDCDDLCKCGHERFHHDDGREMGIYTNCKDRGCCCQKFELEPDPQPEQCGGSGEGRDA